jgi:RNA polymerase sigma-70 factor (ECF subfamily)
VNEFLSHEEPEKELLSLVREGDVKAFEEVYSIYSPKLYANILKLVKSVTITEELLQDTFQRVWEYRKNIDTGKSFKSYIFTIAKNLVYDYFNKASRRRILERYLSVKEEKSGLRIEHQLEEKESALILEKAVRELPPQRKLVYTLCKIEGKSYEDVSKTLGISVSTISDHIVKATKSIKASCLSGDLLQKTTLLVLFILHL